jgi:outer membrane protein OmpA-like peptidoglycan-associated protein
MRFLSLTGLALGGLLLGSCAHQAPKPAGDLIVVAPGQDGRAGSVVVSGAQGSMTLDRPYAAARVEQGGRPEVRSASEAEVRKTFAEAIAARPQHPVSFLLYFQGDSDEYTPESKQAFENVFAELSRRKAAEVTVIGHTDRIGTVEYNDALSLRRAERVRRDFVGRGIPNQSVSVAGRGEREPIVPTADEVAEPRNRRVEINVR